MKVSDIIAHINTRTKETPLVIGTSSDEFLRHLIELHQNALLSEFELNIAVFKKELEKLRHATLDELNAYIKAHAELLKISFASVKK